MDNDTRKRAFQYVISDLKAVLVRMKVDAEKRCDKEHNPGAYYRLAAITSIIRFLETTSFSSEPWIHFTPEKTYNTRRITKQVIALLKKHNVIEGEETAKDIYILNAFSIAWGLVDLIVAQMRNRLTRKKCIQLFESHANNRWERAAETYLSNRTGRGKIRRCLVYLYANQLLPGHPRRDVQSFIRLLDKYDNIDWTKAPDTIQQTKLRLEQLNDKIRQRKKKEREKLTSHEN